MERKRRIGKANPKENKRSVEEGIESSPVPAREESPDANIPDLQAKKRILVVDNEELMLEMISDIIESEHKQCGILTAKDGGPGLQSVRKEGGRLDLIICRSRLPKVDGITMSEIVKEEYPDIPIVIYSGWDMSAEKKLLGKVFFDLLYAPFSADELLLVVNAAFRSKEKKG